MADDNLCGSYPIFVLFTNNENGLPHFLGDVSLDHLTDPYGECLRSNLEMAVGHRIAANFKLAVVHTFFPLASASGYKLRPQPAMNLSFSRNLIVTARTSVSALLFNQASLEPCLLYEAKLKRNPHDLCCLLRFRQIEGRSTESLSSFGASKCE